MSSVLHKLWLRFLHPYLRLWSTWKTDYSFGKPKVTKTEAFSGKFQTAFDPLHGTLFSRNKYSVFFASFHGKLLPQYKGNLQYKLTPRPPFVKILLFWWLRASRQFLQAKAAKSSKSDSPPSHVAKFHHPLLSLIATLDPDTSKYFHTSLYLHFCNALPFSLFQTF